MDDRLTSTLQLSGQKTGQFTSSGLYAGTKSGLLHLLKPLIEVGSPIEVDVQTVSYMEAVYRFAGINKDLQKWQTAQTSRYKFKNTGGFVYHQLPLHAIQTISNFLKIAPNENSLIEFQSNGGFLNWISPYASAFFHRKAIFNMQYITQWNDDLEEEKNIHWVESLRNALLPYINGVYVNYPDINIKDSPLAYYGDNHVTLSRIKRRYDPDHVFQFAQNIPQPPIDR